MLWRVCRAEVARLLGRVRFWVLAAIVLSACVCFLVAEARDSHGSVVALANGQWLVVREYATSLLWDQLGALGLLCLVLPFAVCDTFALDRRSRYLSLLLARGATRATLVVGRALAGCLVCALAVAIVLAAMAVTALAVAPHAHGKVGSLSTFLPGLLDAAPWAYFAIVGGTCALAASGVVALGLLTSALARSWLFAIMTPPLVVLGTELMPLPQSLVPFSPGARATFLDYCLPWATPGSTAVYWTVVLVLVTLTAAVIYRRQEDL